MSNVEVKVLRTAQCYPVFQLESSGPQPARKLVRHGIEFGISEETGRGGKVGVNFMGYGIWAFNCISNQPICRAIGFFGIEVGFDDGREGWIEIKRARGSRGIGSRNFE